MRAAKVVWHVANFLWFAVTFCVLFTELYQLDHGPKYSGFLLVIIMLPISFPLGLVVPIAFVAMAELFAYSPPDNAASMLLQWFGFFVAGYVQWFWVVPRLYRGLSEWWHRKNLPNGRTRV